MTAQLKDDLSSLRLDRAVTRPAPRRGLWFVVVAGILASLAAGGLFLRRTLATAVVETVKPTVTRAGEVRGAARILAHDFGARVIALDLSFEFERKLAKASATGPSRNGIEGALSHIRSGDLFQAVIHAEAP